MSKKRSSKHTRKLKIGGRDIITYGLRAQFRQNIYYHVMNLSWPMFYLTIAGFFVLLNLLFSVLYLLDENAIANLAPKNFLGIFFFSVETLATVGYGDMHPQSVYAHWVATAEIFVGMAGIALITGIMFARFSRPRPSIIFAEHPVSHIEHGRRVLMIRIANERLNIISEASAKLYLMRNEYSPNTGFFRRIHDLKLERDEHPIFTLSWTLIHIIDETSLLFGETSASLEKMNVALILSVDGVDETTNQTQRARHNYPWHTIRWNHRYKDIFSTDENDVQHMHYSRFHESEEIKVPPVSGHGD